VVKFISETPLITKIRSESKPEKITRLKNNKYPILDISFMASFKDLRSLVFDELAEVIELNLYVNLLTGIFFSF